MSIQILSVSGSVSLTNLPQGGSLQSFTYITTTGIYTVPNGINNILVEVLGSGGGGGAGTNAGSGETNFGGGGGSGAYTKKWLTGVTSLTFSATIGSGGQGGQSSGAGGNQGDPTTFASDLVALVTAYGGLGGQAGISNQVAQGGYGGTVSGGDILSTGSNGDDGLGGLIGSINLEGFGYGGSCIYGGGGQGVANGTGYGSGGGGGDGGNGYAGNGGNGSNGIIIVTEYS